ncbi:MAG: DUF871 domain-containing protein [Atopobiaceae bacterium]|nr:DUF871 domain-containing protein [Atopobiaceae bacterium]
MERKDEAVTLGVSVYPDLRPLEEIAAYVVCAAQHGYTRVFSSMFSVEGTPEEVLDLFRRLNGVVHKNGMRISLDINPECMKRFGTAPDDLSVFHAIGADILRMDGAYGEDDNLRMLNNPYGMQIEYNASALTPEAIGALVARGVSRERILACHNFYPQRYTGFRWDKFQAVNKQLQRAGLRIGAFVSSHAPQTHGVWDAMDGLPTVERLRDYPADLQARILAAAGTTDVFFGNAYASDEELEAVHRALQDGCKHVHVEPVYNLSAVEREILFEFTPHVDMGDSSEWMWRSRLPRVTYADKAILPRRHAAKEFVPGDVVMVNDNYKHYAGEVQVVLRPMVNDGMRNLVARINEQEMTMFDVIDSFDQVIFDCDS